MNDDRLSAGFTSVLAGMNGGVSPALIGQNQYALGVNVTNRDGFPRTRPPWTNHYLSVNEDAEANWSGIFQGHCPYNDGQGKVGWVVSRGGFLFFISKKDFSVADITPRLTITITEEFTVPALNDTVNASVTIETPFNLNDTLVIDSGTYTVTGRATSELILTYTGGAAHATVAQGSLILRDGSSVIDIQNNPPTLEFVYLFQAENYVVVLAGQNQTIIWDGQRSRRTGPKEIPPGFVGAYGWGRIWIGLPNRFQFVAGDIVGGDSGTAQLNKRDAILKFTENDYLNEGGAFSVPYNAGLITAMQFLATQDTSLGVGVLLVGTTNMIFSVNAPPDRTTWKNLTYPIQTVSLIDYGPQSPGSPSVNGDWWFRSLDGYRSFIVARRNFPDPGNTPLSREISPIIENDQADLLLFGTGMLFDNRLLLTVSPTRTVNGVHHRGLVSVNFDTISGLQGKSTPAWESVWTGFDICQISKLLIDGSECGFAFVQGSEDLQLWEIEKGNSRFNDRFVQFPGDSITETQIACALETRAENYGSPPTLKDLLTGCIYLDDIAGEIQITIKFRPDQYPGWITWKQFTVCAQNVSQCQVIAPGVTGCPVWKPYARLYAPRIMLPKPPSTCVSGMLISKLPTLAHEYQFRIEWTGHLRIRRFETFVKPANQPMNGDCPEEILSCVSIQDCGTDYFSYAVPN